VKLEDLEQILDFCQHFEFEKSMQLIGIKQETIQKSNEMPIDAGSKLFLCYSTYQDLSNDTNSSIDSKRYFNTI
jgi:hypothetical protein